MKRITGKTDNPRLASIRPFDPLSVEVYALSLMTFDKEALRITELRDKFELVQTAAQDEQAAASLRLALQAICEVIVTKLGYEAAWIGLNDEAKLEVRRTPQTGTEKGRPAVAQPEDETSEIANSASVAERGSAISFPLKVGDIAIGTLRVHSATEDAPSPQETKILEVFSETAAFAVEKANVNVGGLTVGTTKRRMKQFRERSVDPGEVYLFKGSLEELLQLFRNHLESGWSGLLICGRSTDRIIGVEQLRTVPTFEITGDASLINAVWSYTGLATLVVSFMHATQKPLVVVDRLEKLEESPQKGHLDIFIEDLRRQAKEVNGTAIIRMESIEDKWLGTIEKFCRFL